MEPNPRQRIDMYPSSSCPSRRHSQQKAQTAQRLGQSRSGNEIAAAVGVKLTHPDKVMYPGTKVTKSTLAAYYAVVAEKMLPHIQDRPLSLVRDTHGDLQQTFFQKHNLPGVPSAIHDGHLEKVSGKESRISWSMTWLG
ncbi:hypothetical protein NKI06_29000 [Mesorhizobium sp. M0772]